ncbi:MFS-type transporter clz9-like [Alosa alosa]|nr:MFS-type transporter clz9-like [Alosa alosa]
MDQHEAHVGTGVVDFCRANRIEVVCLPAHTTHVLQPLDVAVYGSLKAAFSRLAGNMGLVRGDLVIGKRQFTAVLKYALEEACTPHNIISGFRRTGLFPLNRMEVDESKFVKGLRDRSAGGECFDAPEDTDEDMSTPPCTVDGAAANAIPLSTTIATTREVATTTTPVWRQGRWPCSSSCIVNMYICK